jgi:ribosomal protein S18 acetylase RimI-like enzyme
VNRTEIYKIGADDVFQLQNLGRQTFFETFAEHNPPENLDAYLAESFSTDKLTRELNNPDSAFYFAYFDKKLAGYLKINFGQAQTELNDSESMEIERIYVLSEFQGQKIGQALFVHALKIAKEAGCPYIWLGVWEKNHKALNFYRKNGFVEFDRHIFRIGDDEQTDFLMKRNC